jgi:hypothetical protein
MSVKRKVSVSMVRSVGERSSTRHRRIAESSLAVFEVPIGDGRWVSPCALALPRWILKEVSLFYE